MEHITEPWQVIVLGVAGLVFAVGLVLWIRAGIAPDAEPVDFEPRTLVADAWSEMIHWRPVNMSSTSDEEALRKAAVPPVVATFTTAEQPIVMPNNEYNGGVYGNDHAAIETTAKLVAVLYQKGIITNLSKGICAAYGCTVQSASKSDSTYQLALKAVNRHLPKSNMPQFRTTPEMENAREALGLNKV